jgi:hypothetical protein
MSLLVILMLGGKRLPLHQWMTSCKQKIGTIGLSSAPMHAATLTSSTLKNLFNSSSSSPLL